MVQIFHFNKKLIYCICNFIESKRQHYFTLHYIIYNSLQTLRVPE